MMKNHLITRKLRLESLEERILLAVTAGFKEVAAELAAPTSAASWVVNTTDDPADWDSADDILSLREAIDRAADGDKIVFESSLAGGTITLNGTELGVNKGITIDASEIGGITINADGKDRVFQVNGGTSDMPVELIALTITGGLDYGMGGGGINNAGNLILSGCTVKGNASHYYGGGILNRDNGTLLVKNSTIQGNIGDVEGGGISNFGNSLTMIDSVVDGNLGVGVECYSSETILINCTVKSNNSCNTIGGGVVNWWISGLTMINCAVYGNHTYFVGGGIYSGSDSSLINCTITGNVADQYGGGVSGLMNLTNSIVTLNKAGYNNSDDVYFPNDGSKTLAFQAKPSRFSRYR